MKVYVAGYKGAGFGGKAITWFTNGEYSHVSLVFDHGGGILTEIDSIQGAGVAVRRYGDMDKPHDLFEVRCTPATAVCIHYEAKKLIGLKYDWAGIWGMLRRRKRENSKKWFCSELVAYCLEENGIKLMRLPAWKITPVMACASMALKPVNAIGE